MTPLQIKMIELGYGLIIATVIFSPAILTYLIAQVVILLDKFLKWKEKFNENRI